MLLEHAGSSHQVEKASSALTGIPPNLVKSTRQEKLAHPYSTLILHMHIMPKDDQHVLHIQQNPTSSLVLNLHDRFVSQCNKENSSYQSSIFLFGLDRLGIQKN